MNDLAVGIDKRLRVYSTHAFQITYVEGILRTQIAGMSRFNFTAGHIILMLAFQGGNLRIAEYNPLIRDFGFQCA